MSVSMSSSNMPISISSSTTSTRLSAFEAGPVMFGGSCAIESEMITMLAEPRQTDNDALVSSILSNGQAEINGLREKKFPGYQTPRQPLRQEPGIRRDVISSDPPTRRVCHGLESRRRKLEAVQGQGQGAMGPADR